MEPAQVVDSTASLPLLVVRDSCSFPSSLVWAAYRTPHFGKRHTGRSRYLWKHGAGGHESQWPECKST